MRLIRQTSVRARSVLCALVLASGASAAPRRETLVNHGKNIRWQPAIVHHPGASIEELSTILKDTRRQTPQLTIKAGGSRHAWSPAAATNGVYIQPERMRFIERPAFEELRADHPKGLFRVGSGTTVREINHTLWQLGMALPSLGGFDGQTLGGVLPTGTHGSVLTHGPLVDIVQSTDLVRADGQKVRLEPANGVTDPLRFRRSHPDWKLVQNDEDFRAALVNVGTFGIVHSYVIKARPRFYLDEVRTAGTGRDTQALLRGERIYHLMQSERAADGGPDAFPGHPARAYHFEVLWNPYTDRTLVTSRNPLDEDASAKLAAHEPHYFDKSLNGSIKRLWKTDPRYMRRHVTELVAENASTAAGKLMELVATVAPKLVPTLVDLSMRGLEDKGYTQRSYNVFNIGDGENRIPAQSATLSIPVGGDKYLDAMDVLRDVAKRYAAEHHAFQTGPISLRFVKGSTASLADPVDVCKFELIFGGDGKNAQALSRGLVDAYYTALHEKFGADVRVHFGQLLPDSYVADGKSRLEASHPDHANFARARKKFDPDGTFSNASQKALLP